MKYSIYMLSLPLFIGISGCDTRTATEHEAESEDSHGEQAEPVETFTNLYKSPLPDSAPTYKVSTSGIQAPFSFQDEYGNLQGIDIDAIRAIGEIEGFKPEIYKDSFNTMLEQIENSERDILISAISYSDEREEKYTLTNPYLFVPSAMMYKDPKLNINGLADIEGLRISGAPQTAQYRDLTSKIPDIQPVPVATTYLAYEKLNRGEADILADDVQVLQYLALNHDDKDVKIWTYETEEDLPSQQVILLRKNNTELATKLNSGIDKLKKTGTFKEIEQKWLDSVKQQ